MSQSKYGNTYASERELAPLRPLAARFCNIDAAMTEIARLSAVQTLPKGTVHVISDIHGEDQKLRHVINNASGSMRPLVEEVLKDRLSADEFQKFITLIFYPGEVIQHLEAEPRTAAELEAYAVTTLRNLFELVRILSARYSLKRAMEMFPGEYRELLAEMLH